MKLRGTGALVVALSALILVSCSTGPQPPKVGTPAFYWVAAQETYAAGDYPKAVQHLEGVIKTDNEYTARAYPWYLVLEAGMARGYAELAENFEYGAKANRGNPTPFRRQMNDYRTMSSRLSLSLAEAFEKFEKTNTDARVPLAFAYPTGSPFPSSHLQKIAAGQMPQPAIVEDLRRSHLQTSVLMTATRVVGAPDDTAKTQEVFKSPDASVPARGVFYRDGEHPSRRRQALHAEEAERAQAAGVLRQPRDGSAEASARNQRDQGPDREHPENAQAGQERVAIRPSRDR